MGKVRRGGYEGPGLRTGPAADPRSPERGHFVKIRKVETNNRKGEFRVVTYSGDTYVFPYVKAEPQPDSANKVDDAYVDRELANEAFSYVPEFGDEGYLHFILYL